MRTNHFNCKFFSVCVIGMVLVASNITLALPGDDEIDRVVSNGNALALTEDGKPADPQWYIGLKEFNENELANCGFSVDLQKLNVPSDALVNFSESANYSLVSGPITILEGELIAATEVMLSNGTYFEGGSDLFLDDIIEEGILFNNGNAEAVLQSPIGKTVLIPGKIGIVIKSNVQNNGGTFEEGNRDRGDTWYHRDDIKCNKEGVDGKAACCWMRTTGGTPPVKAFCECRDIIGGDFADCFTPRVKPAYEKLDVWRDASTGRIYGMVVMKDI